MNIYNELLLEDMSRAIGALAVGGVGVAVAASNSLYTGESTSKIHNIISDL